jgi:hypothetical protein
MKVVAATALFFLVVLAIFLCTRGLRGEVKTLFVVRALSSFCVNADSWKEVDYYSVSCELLSEVSHPLSTKPFDAIHVSNREIKNWRNDFFYQNLCMNKTMRGQRIERVVKIGNFVRVSEIPDVRMFRRERGVTSQKKH